MSLKIGVCMDFFFSIEQSYPLYGMFGNTPQTISNVHI